MHGQKGISVIEVLLAAAMFVIFATGGVTIILQGFDMNRNGTETVVATQYASEGIEALRSIKNQNFSLLSNNSNTGIIRNINNVWSYDGSNNVWGRYTRTLSISDVYRDGTGNIVASGGTLDALSKKIASTVAWNFTNSRPQTVTLISYLTNWRGGKKGILVYSNGSMTSDLIQYQIFDGTTWSTTQSTADIDSATTNRYLRIARVYASPTRNEKIMVSRHYNGTTQYIYSQVFDGTNWGNVQLLSSWNATNFVDVQNFDATYLNNGDLMVVFSDNTITPKFRTWNGSVWSAQVSLNVLPGTPLHVEIEQRPGTNEIMAAFLDSANDTLTEYFNGGAYSTANWSTRTSHATNTVTTSERLIGFKWNINTPTTGALFYATGTNDKRNNGKIYIANGTGGGAWAGAAVRAVTQANNLGSMKIISHPTRNEFLACNKDGASSPTIVCRQLTFSGTTATWVTPINPIVAPSTDTGIQASFGLNYEIGSSAQALITYGDNTNIPKYKLFNPLTSTISASATIINTAPYTLGSPIRTVREIVEPIGGSIMTIFTDNNLDLYSTVWNGSFSSITQHGQNGSVNTDYWYDFVWDANY